MVVQTFFCSGEKKQQQKNTKTVNKRCPQKAEGEQKVSRRGAQGEQQGRGSLISCSAAPNTASGSAICIASEAIKVL